MLNREFKVIFQPIDKTLHKGRRRFGISPNQLAKYIGDNNVNVALNRAYSSLDDKIRVKFRTKGILDFYRK